MGQQKAEGAPAKNQAVNRYADGVAGQDPHPLVFFCNSGLPEMINLGVDEFTDDFGDDAGNDNAPDRA